MQNHPSINKERIKLTIAGDLRKVVFAPSHALPFLQPGRLVRVLPPKEAERGAAVRQSTDPRDEVPVSVEPEAVWAVVVNFERLSGTDSDGNQVTRDNTLKAEAMSTLFINITTHSSH
eukprot:scaffold215926_cov25-Prasinocladus_malaysianus.AAC.1